MIKKIITIFIAVLLANNLLAQSYNMSNQTISTCSGTFYDDGGASLNYLPNQNDTMTICAGTSGAQIQLLFNMWDIQSPLDFLYVYNGNNTSAPLLGVFSDGVIPNILTSSNTSGCLTLVFTSANPVFPAQGWQATIACVPNFAIGSADSCSSATPYCSNLAFNYAANYNPTGSGTSAQTGPDYGCLFTQPNPSWFYFKVDQSGDIVVNISSTDSSGITHDVDFICWGPFTSATAPCASQLTAGNIDSCSYSSSAVEVLSITGATAGSYYLLMVTNFANVATNISMGFNPSSTAAINNDECISKACNIPYFAVKSAGCNNGTSYNAALTIITQNPPTTGTLVIKSPTGTTTLTPPFADTIQTTINNIPTGYLDRDTFWVYFSADTFCKARAMILPSVYAGPDRNYCSGNSPIGVSVLGKGPFHWSPTAGIISANADSSSIQILPTVSGTYVVTGDSSNACKYKDTIQVNVLPPFTVAISVADSSICLKALAQLSVNTTSTTGSAPYIYTWKDIAGNTVSTSATLNITPLATMQYYVSVYSSEGCLAVDSQLVNVTAVAAPDVKILADKNFVCPGDTIKLTPSVSTLACGLTPGGLANACSNVDPIEPYSTDTLGGFSGGSTNVTPFRGFWHDGRVQYIIRAPELQSLGMKAGTITGFVFWVTSKASTAPYNGFTVKIGATNLNTFPSANFVAGLQTVINPFSLTTNVGPIPLTFDNPYDWDGFSNLIIETCFDNAAWSGYDEVNTTSSIGNTTLVDETDGAVGCTLSSPLLFGDRPTVRFEMCLPALSNYSYNWMPSSGLSCDTCLNTQLALHSSQSLQLNVTDLGTGCVGSDIIQLNTDTTLSIYLTPKDTTLCSSDTIHLFAGRKNPASPVCMQSYSQSTIPYNALSGTGTNVSWDAFTDGDEGYSTLINIPFTFKYFCNDYTQLRVSSNGFVSLGATPPPTFLYAQTIPSAPTPNNFIALCWDDLDQSAGGTIKYYTTGTAPNRVFVIKWTNVEHYSSTAVVSGEIHLNETTNFVEIHTLLQNDNGTHTQGVENAAGTAGAATLGRNNTSWTVATPEGVLFTPNFQGTSPLTYQWTPVAPATAGMANIATPFDSSTFVSPTQSMNIAFQVLYTNGCVIKDTASIHIGSFPIMASANPLVVCSGDTSRLNVVATNGDSVVSYNWTPSANLSAGNIKNPLATIYADTKFYVDVTNKNGCTARDSIMVTTFKRDSLHLTLSKDTVCPGQSITVGINDPSAPFAVVNWYSLLPNYTLVNSANLNSISFTQPNLYQAQIIENGCRYLSDTFVLSNRIDPKLIASKDDTICQGASVNINATNGFSNYNWNNGNQTTTITTSTTGDYFYTAKDNWGCVWHSDTATILVIQNPTINFTPFKNPKCVGESVVLNAGSIAGAIYTWNPGGVGNTITATTPTTYNVTATIGDCSATGNITVNEVPNPIVFLPGDTATCTCGASITVAPTNQSVIPANSTYSWSTPSVGSTATITSSTALTLTVTDPNGCSAVANRAMNIAINCLSINAAAIGGNSIFPNQNATITVDNITLNGNVVNIADSSLFSYNWTPTSSLQTPNAYHTIASPSQTQLYTVVVEDTASKCSSSDTITIYVVNNIQYAVATAFTPNGDGTNDEFFPTFSDKNVNVVSFHVYNEWNQLVHAQTTPWKGNYLTTNAPQPMGVYTYYISFEKPNPNKPSEKINERSFGSFTLIR